MFSVGWICTRGIGFPDEISRWAQGVAVGKASTQGVAGLKCAVMQRSMAVPTLELDNWHCQGVSLALVRPACSDSKTAGAMFKTAGAIGPVLLRRNLRHDRPFTLSMANAGPNTNGSQVRLGSACTVAASTAAAELVCVLVRGLALEMWLVDGLSRLPLSQQPMPPAPPAR